VTDTGTIDLSEKRRESSMGLTAIIKLTVELGKPAIPPWQGNWIGTNIYLSLRARPRTDRRIRNYLSRQIAVAAAHPRQSTWTSSGSEKLGGEKGGLSEQGTNRGRGVPGIRK